MRTTHGMDTMENEPLAHPGPPPPAHLRSGEHHEWMHQDSELDRGVPESGSDGDAWVPTGRIVNIRFLRAALRRLRWLWLAAATLGLCIGLGYHLAVPFKYSATASISLSQAGGKQARSDDVAILESPAVANRAAALLGKKHLTPTTVLGKKAVAFRGDTLDLTASGSSAKAAVRRANALASAFLAVRKQTLAEQTKAVLAADAKEVSKLQAEISSLSTQISHLPKKTTTQVPALKSQRAVDTKQLVRLETSMAATTLKAQSASQGSKILAPATAQAVHYKRAIALDGLSGLVGGLGVGLMLAVLIAILSDKPRTREDVSSLLGVPVGLSVGHPGGRWAKWRSPSKLASHPDKELSFLARYLGDRLSRGAHASSELVVAIDDVAVTAAALLLLARHLASVGETPVLVDATDSRELARAVGMTGPGSRTLETATGVTLRVVALSHPWEGGGDGDDESRVALEGTATALVLATVNPSLGAQHLRRWGSEAVLVLTAGSSSAQRIGAVGELLRAADITIGSAALLGTDRRDESAGQVARRLAWD